MGKTVAPKPKTRCASSVYVEQKSVRCQRKIGHPGDHKSVAPVRWGYGWTEVTLTWLKYWRER